MTYLYNRTLPSWKFIPKVDWHHIGCHIINECSANSLYCLVWGLLTDNNENRELQRSTSTRYYARDILRQPGVCMELKQPSKTSGTYCCNGIRPTWNTTCAIKLWLWLLGMKHKSTSMHWDPWEIGMIKAGIKLHNKSHEKWPLNLSFRWQLFLGWSLG